MILPLAYGHCNVSVMPLRGEPSHRAEQTSQLLYGERVEIIEVNKSEWAKVRCAWDGYDGWCKKSQIAVISRKDYLKPLRYIAGTNADRIILPEGDLWLPTGSDLIGYKGGKLVPVKDQGKYKGKKIAISEIKPDCDTLRKAGMQYIHAPYQWGGRSIAGIDCSGLSQMVYKMCNIPIMRDASQQATQGELVDFLQHAQCGDLAFFDDKDGRIVHVGMLLDNQNIIHATETSGRVVIDRIDQGGIISVTLRKRTHNLRMVRRMVKEVK